MNDVPRASTSGPGANRAVIMADCQVAIPSHVYNVPGIGDVLFHHAQAVNVATISADGAGERIALILAMPGCDCGCQSRGRGLILTPDADDARRIGERLIKMADTFEAEAAQAAAAAIARAAGK